MLDSARKSRRNRLQRTRIQTPSSSSALLRETSPEPPAMNWRAEVGSVSEDGFVSPEKRQSQEVSYSPAFHSDFNGSVPQVALTLSPTASELGLSYDFDDAASTRQNQQRGSSNASAIGLATRHNMEATSSLPPKHPNSIFRSREQREGRYDTGGDKNYAFQIPEGRASVSVRTVDLANRTAFERVFPVNSDDVLAAADARLFTTVGDGSNSRSHRKRTTSEQHDDPDAERDRAIRKVSPSPNHADLLRWMLARPRARQLCWTPGVSAEADPFYNWDGHSNGFDLDNVEGREGDDDTHPADEYVENDTDLEDRRSKHRFLAEKRRRKKLLDRSRRSKACSGVYHTPIHPLHHARSVLPTHMPLLSNVRRRLPNRADVGFPGATEKEVQSKHTEIAMEAELEEASPRLVVLLSAEDALAASTGSPGDSAASYHAGPGVVSTYELGGKATRAMEDCGWLDWRGTTPVPDVPFAGKELIEARWKAMDTVSVFPGLHSLPAKDNIDCDDDDDDDAEETKNEILSSKLPPSTATTVVVPAGRAKTFTKPPFGPRPKSDPTSVFSPPLDATHSSTQLWRARPFTDRPPGMSYILAAPIDVKFDVGDIEPLVCTMALYVLPRPQSSDALNKTFCGKISEDFVFPAGDWRGLLREEAGKRLASHFYGASAREDKNHGERSKTKSEANNHAADNDENDEDNAASEQKWRKRKRRALFAYDPLVLPASEEDNQGGKCSLHIVVQVHKVTHVDAALAYFDDPPGKHRRGSTEDSVFVGINEGTSTKPKSIGGRIKRAVSKSVTRTTSPSAASLSGAGNTSDIQRAPSSFVQERVETHSRAMAAFERLGTQFLTPLCFGVGPVFPLKQSNVDDLGDVDCLGGDDEEDNDEDDGMHWPDGHTQDIQFYSFPPVPESQEAFAERLSNLAEEQKSGTKATESGDGGDGDVKSTASTVFRGSGFVSPKKFDDSQNYSMGGQETRGTVHAQSSSKDESSIASSLSFPPSVADPEWAQLKSKKTKSAIPLLRLAGRDGSIGSVTSGALHSIRAAFRQSKVENHQIAGHTTVLTSVLGVDFTQALLETPALLYPTLATVDGIEWGRQRLPRLLVDVTGDCAIMMNPDASENSNSRRKRSNLVRLPPSTTPSEYADSFEIKEVLYFPPRGERQYDSDVPITSSTFLNVLYLYPRMIRFAPDSEGSKSQPSQYDKKKNEFFSIRIRLVQQGIEEDETTGAMETVYTPMDAVYNPAPGGRLILQAVYTKIPHSLTGGKSGSGLKSSSINLSKGGVALRDEVKVRLPDVLDGSHFLQFGLMSIQLVDDFNEEMDQSDSGGVIAECIAETLIPLSSSIRETNSRVRTATVIPNGIHRIRLGAFQLQVESRLVSSIHVSDPAVATILRDFPFAKEPGTLWDDIRTVNLGKSNGSYHHQALHEMTATERASSLIPFSNILSSASIQAVVGFFEPLVYMHFCNLIHGGTPPFDFDCASSMFLGEAVAVTRRANASNSNLFSFMTENLRNLFEIIRLVKEKFALESFSRRTSSRRLRRFCKNFVDAFDESTYSSQPRELRLNQPSAESDEKHLESSVSSQSAENLSGISTKFPGGSQIQVDNIAELVVDTLEEKLIEGAARAVSQQYMHSNFARSVSHDVWLTRSHSNLSTHGTPLSRKAFGATKTDQMRAEAELYGSSKTRFTPFFDDDETVMTMDTRKHELERPSIATILEHPSQENSSNKSSTDHRVRDEMKRWGITNDEEFDFLTQTSTFGSGIDLSNSTNIDSVENDVVEEPASRTTPFSERARLMARSFGDGGFAKRVNTVAQVVMAPCMAPSSSAVLVTGTENSPNRTKTADDETHNDSSLRLLVNKLGDSALSTGITPDLPEESTGTDDSQFLEDNFCSIYFSGSDVEQDIDQNPAQINAIVSDPNMFPTIPIGTALRGVAAGQTTQVDFSLPSIVDYNSVRSKETSPYLYEPILVLCVQSWMDYVSTKDNGEQTNSGKPEFDASSMLHFVFLFSQNVDFILPLCLKSIALRCTAGSSEREKIPSNLLDAKHMQVLISVIVILARCFVSQAAAIDFDDEEADKCLVNALTSSNSVIEFLVGMLAIVHPSQVSILIEKYFSTLRECEHGGDALLGEEVGTGSRSHAEGNRSSLFTWTKSKLRNVRCSRQLRLRAIEKFSSIPRFVGLNFPVKYAERTVSPVQKPSSWTHQGPDRASAETFLPPCENSDRIPRAHWLADLLSNEGFSICSLSCEAVVVEAMSQTKESQEDNLGAERKRKLTIRNQGVPLTRDDLLRFQSTAVHAVMCIYELLLRRHATDDRFHPDNSLSRVTAMFFTPVLENSIRNVHWLARMESTHKVRCLWLLSVLYIFQESPEALLRQYMQGLCTFQDYRIHRFIRILRLCTTTFQCYFTGREKFSQTSKVLNELSPWLVQESFNTLCATTIILVDECPDIVATNPIEQRRMAQGILDVLLHIVTTPQSSITHLRALGGASQALEKFGAVVFLDVVGDNLQHWARTIFTQMNSISLSVRSMTVDLLVSLLGGVFQEGGNMDEVSLVFITVLPEVVAREIAFYAVSGQIVSMTDVETCLWPLRRGLADVDETNPLDDSRVDPQLSPFLSSFCRTCQAVIDGVIIELRLHGDDCVIVGTKVARTAGSHESKLLDKNRRVPIEQTFDADEESLLEAASFFMPETGPMQRIRWLLTLASLHESKGQWVEAAETLILCARTVADAILHVKNVWRPSRFVLWRDVRRSLWLSTIGEELGVLNQRNTQVMEFADNFLEPPSLIPEDPARGTGGRLKQPTVDFMCRMLTNVTREAVPKYLEEYGMESLAYLRLEELLKSIMGVGEDYSAVNANFVDIASQTFLVEENAALRKMSASLNHDMTKLAERMLLLAEEGEVENRGIFSRHSSGRSKVSNQSTINDYSQQHYVRVLLLGRKPGRFQESTTIPTFLEWGTPSICRIPKSALDREKDLFGVEGKSDQALAKEECLSKAIAGPLIDAILQELPEETVFFRTEIPTEEELIRDGDSKTFIVVTLVHMEVENCLPKRGELAINIPPSTQSKRFWFKRKLTGGQSPLNSACVVEHTVAQQFPCALSRQRTLITSEFFARS